jgi:hypothetical protein
MAFLSIQVKQNPVITINSKEAPNNDDNILVASDGLEVHIKVYVKVH